MEKFLRMMGLKKEDDYIVRYFEHANVRSSIYMTVIVIILEVWMILRTLIKYVILSDKTRDLHWIVSHFSSYFLLLGSAAAVLVFSVKYLRSNGTRGKACMPLIVVFSVICVGFGIYISRTDYINHNQIITFINMMLFTTCLLIWRPYVSILVLSGTFLLFRGLVTAGGGAFTEGDSINYFTIYISIVMISLSIYNQRYIEASKDKGLTDANKRLEKLAIEDELTGIPNMHRFCELASAALADTNINISEKAFFFVDFENFKSYNAKLGFEKGNEFLVRAASELRDAFPGEIIARHSDDHFVLFAPKDGTAEKITEIGEKLCLSGENIYMNVKTGFCVPADRNCDPRIACDSARYVCSLIKKHSDKPFMEFSSESAMNYRRAQYIVNNIDNAVKNGFIKVYYQPVVWCGSKELCGCEALARWIDPEYGFLSPGAFIPVLEDYRLIDKLDRCIFRSVCRDIREALDGGKPVVPVSMNFSRLDFELMDAVSVLEEYVNEYRVPKEYLHVEITESALTDNGDLLKTIITEFHSKGYAVWLDDFGSGYSSLNVLKDYNFDVMKIDMKFLSGFEDPDTSDKAKVIIDKVISLANGLGMRTLTEGVETDSQVTFLNEKGCDRLQGYFFGKPMPIEQFHEEIDSGRFTVSDDLL